MVVPGANDLGACLTFGGQAAEGILRSLPLELTGISTRQENLGDCWRRRLDPGMGKGLGPYS